MSLLLINIVFGEIIGKSGKEPHLVLKENKEELYLGGAGAVARHISSFVKRINLLSPFGGENLYKKLIKSNFEKNITLNFIKPSQNYKTIQKTRFVDQISNYKLFGSYILPDKNNFNYEIK